MTFNQRGVMKVIFGLRGVAAAALALSSVALFSTSIEGSSASAASSTFVIGTVNSVQKIDPDIVTNFLYLEALGLIYNTLVQENSKLQIVPDLATSWSARMAIRLSRCNLVKV